MTKGWGLVGTAEAVPFHDAPRLPW